MDKWRIKIKRSLLGFLQEFKETCLNCGRKAEEVKVLFATKYLDSEQLVAFLEIAKDFMPLPILIGENRVQEAEEKFDFFHAGPAASVSQTRLQTRPDMPGSNMVKPVFGMPSLASPASSSTPDKVSLDLKNYFSPILIGNLQKNKINRAIKLFDEIHAVDSLEVAEGLNRRLEVKCHAELGSASPKQSGEIPKQVRDDKSIAMPVYLEVNVSGEETKHGFTPEEIEGVMKTMKQCSNVTIKGLMTMAPYYDDPQNSRPIFRTLRKLADKYHLQTSMGMSHDWKVAIEEGADMIRVGQLIFNKV
jgi:uncharacterized pyridoxal phosphate-containing UPF0001 family protein